ncbi:MAG TPA: response regulator [Bacteroidia bacterium]|nr:response regulator [Bacteroidia bacterium]
MKRVMIADDDLDDQMLVQEVIQEIDPRIEILIMPDGVKLMHTLQSFAHPDLLLLDLNMPFKNGMDCLAEIKADPGMKDIPVVVLSTSKSVRDVEQSFALGAHLFLTKPNTYEELRKMIGSLLHIKWEKFRSMLHKRHFMRIATEGSIEIPEEV